jgi:DNA polymerase-1
VAIKNYGLIGSIEELAEYIERIIDGGRPFGFDIETGYIGAEREKAALHPETAIVVGISFTDSTDWARYVPLAHDTGENLDNYQAARLFWYLLNTGMGVAHNAPFELRHLAKWFRDQLGEDENLHDVVAERHGYYPIRSDTQVEAYLMAEFQRFGLKPLTKELFGHTMTELHELFEDLAKNKRKFLRFNTLELTPQVVEYACEDSAWCLAIHERYYEQVKDRLLFKVEKAIVQDVIPRMEDVGVRYDWNTMRRVADELRDFRDKFNAEIMIKLSELAGQQIAVNLASPPQIADTLFTKLGYRTTVYTDKTRDLPPDQRKMSTGAIALTKLAAEYPVVKRILQWKEMTRLLGTYLDKYEGVYGYAEDGHTHPNHMSAIVVTGRFAVADPPYQQSPKKYHFDLDVARDAHERGETPPPGTCFTFNFRDVIVAPPEHYIFGFDLSQAELRAIAGEANETALLEAFANGEDVHSLTASLMLGVPLEDVTKEHRDIGKTMNFALLYGMGVKSLADRLGLPVEEAQSLMDKYFAGYPNIATWGQRQIEHGKRYGYVTSKFGRRLPIWEYQSDKRWIYQKGDRACVNYPIQGAATGDYMKIAMVRANAAINAAGLADKIRLVMNIHDALEFYVHKSVDPQQVLGILKPAVVFEVPGWPDMRADWHLAKKWGSPLEIDMRDDGTLLVKGEKVYELAPAVEVDEDTGEAVEVMPDVDAELLRQAAAPNRSRVEPTHDIPAREIDSDSITAGMRW